MRCMVIFSAEGPVSVDPRDVLAIFRGGSDGRYTHCVLVLSGGREIAGALANAALASLEARLAEDVSPPEAA